MTDKVKKEVKKKVVKRKGGNGARITLKEHKAIRELFMEGESISAIARATKLAHGTVKKYIYTGNKQWPPINEEFQKAAKRVTQHTMDNWVQRQRRWADTINIGHNAIIKYFVRLFADPARLNEKLDKMSIKDIADVIVKLHHVDTLLFGGATENVKVIVDEQRAIAHMADELGLTKAEINRYATVLQERINSDAEDGEQTH